jgi:exopolysaccharide biosynthesis polyprenyl glycosylphosphotransferase
MTAITNAEALGHGLRSQSFCFPGQPTAVSVASPVKRVLRPDRGTADRTIRTTVRSAIAWSPRVWGAVDMFMAALAFALGHSLSPYHADPLKYNLMPGAATFAGFVLIFSYVLGAYDRHNFTSVARMGRQAVSVNALALAATCLAFHWFAYAQIGRYAALGTFATSTALVLLCRMVARELACRAKIRVMFVGPRRKFRPLAVQIRLHHGAFYHRPAYFETEGGSVAEQRAKLAEAFQRHQPDEIVVLDDHASLLPILHHSTSILSAGCGIHSYRAYYEDLLREVPVDAIDGRGVLGDGFNIGGLHTGLAKRPMDVALAAFGLLAGAPVMLLVALLVKLTSPGPIIYKQVRVGRYGRPFWIYKFRTMRTDAERNGAVWAKTRDSRVTPIGGLLRKTRFDELPQLWNILRGDMSLVGPRPERPEFVEQLKAQIPHYELRHLVPPGLTGWAQVRFRYGSTIADTQRKLAFDLYYVRHCGLAFDVAICLRTLAAMAKGAR